MSENGEIYTAGKNFTLPPALTALTNSTSGCSELAKTTPGLLGELLGETLGPIQKKCLFQKM